MCAGRLLMLHRKTLLSAISILAIPGISIAAGLYPTGQTARSMSLGGVDVTGGTSPVDALANNPASLAAFPNPTAGFSLTYAQAEGTFSNKFNASASMRESGIKPGLALALPLGSGWTAGFGFVPDIAMRARWNFVDAPGGADGGTSYGLRAHESEIIALRTTAALSWQATETLSLGASVGAVYNENRLNAPYTFQNQATLRTVKTLLDLNTTGTGWGLQTGLNWHPTKDLSVGLSYRSEVRIESDGTARGDARSQLDRLGLGGARSDFAYDAGVNNTLPPMVSLGAQYQASARLRLAAQLDWIGWERTFDTLVVDLKNGNNDDLNGLTKSRNIHDEIPLNWRDQWVGRIGAEYALSDSTMLRAGYAYSPSPVPGETLTPLNAAISEHTVGVGIGHTRGAWTWDFAAQADIPHTQSAGRSTLAAGEYNNSSVKVGIWSLSISTQYKF